MRVIKKAYQYFSIPTNLAFLNGGLIVILILLNTYFQAFCIPTTWTIFVLAICFLNTTLYPILDKTKLAPWVSFINGVSLFVFTYCVLFLEQMNFFGLVFAIAGIGLLTFIPHFFVAQLIWKNLIKPTNKTSRYFFLTALILCTGTIMYIGEAYKNAIVSIEKFKSSNYTLLEKDFMTEKILGMHFIYHTRFCEFDGWRPPKHEPILIIGMWLNKRNDPLNVDLKTRLVLYKKFFPGNRYKFDCSCAIAHRNDYQDDELWK